MKENKSNLVYHAFTYNGKLRYRISYIFMIVISLILLARHFLSIDRGLDFIVSRVTIDDTFYYLNTAWNQRHIGFTTFDGINKTNGVQFLWYWILVIFSYFFETRESFLYGSLVFCSLLSVWAIFIAYRLGQVLDLGWKSIVPALAIANLAAYNKTLIVGLENTIQLVLILFLAVVYFSFLKNLKNPGSATKKYIQMTCLLSLITWARLDNAPVSAILFMHATIEFWQIYRSRFKLYLPKVLICFGVIGLSVFILFYGFYLMGGSIIPVSGLWKARPVEEINLIPVFINAWQNALQRVFAIEHILNKGLMRWASVVLSTLFFVVLIYRYLKVETVNKPLLRGVFFLFLSILVHQIIMVFKLPKDAVGRGFWYQAPQYVLMVIMISLLINWLSKMQHLQFKGIFLRPGAIASIFFVINTLVFSFYTNYSFLVQTDYDKFHFQRVNVARWLHSNLPKTARLGSMNSGELGFFSQLSVTNLDGLINSYDYYRFRKNGGGMREFCKLQGIDYYIDYNIPADMKKNSEVVYTFESRPALQLLRITKILP